MGKEVGFWGKIRGIERDYYICQGTVNEDGKVAPFDCDRATFKSTDCIVWTPLLPVDSAMAAKCAEFNGYFSGDLSKIYGAAPDGDATEDGAAVADDVVTEEKRLTQGTDFLDSICDDEPEGCWSSQFDAASSSLQLRDNLYAGYVAFASVSPHNCFGSCYFGDGIVNNDLAFQLPGKC